MNSIKMKQLQQEIEDVISSSHAMLSQIESQQQQQLSSTSCNGCRQRDQRISQLEASIQELRAALSSANGAQQLTSTFISERQQHTINQTMLELMNDKQRSEEKYKAAVQELELYKTQLKIYQDDFNAERDDRAQARGQLAKAEADRDKYLQQLEECVRELSRHRSPAAAATQQNCSQQFYNQHTATRSAFAPYAAAPLAARGSRQYFPVGIDETDASVVASDCKRSSSAAGPTNTVGSRNSSPASDFTADDTCRPFSQCTDDRYVLDCGKNSPNGRSGSQNSVGLVPSESFCEIDLLSFAPLNDSRSSPSRPTKR